ETRFFEFLEFQGLASMWHQVLSRTTAVQVSNRFLASLQQTRCLETAHYMLQTQALKTIKKLLGQACIDYVIIKGCHVRELIYEQPAVRPAGDIDVLISLHNKVQAIQAFIDAGYQLTANPETISHAVSLTKGSLCIDLHWDILRPGRTRIPLPIDEAYGTRHPHGPNFVGA
ncbi:MAG: nucleotidyltransferase family protein, partial [Nitrospinae bacterium]|nr:nucleotidyltransferase family protein [Nitrospinota bacterium]